MGALKGQHFDKIEVWGVIYLPRMNSFKIKFFGYLLTINALLILKMRDIIFFLRANYIMGHFKGYFEGAKTFLSPKLSRAQRGAILGSKKSRPPRNIPRNEPLCSLPKSKKNNIPNFQKSAVHWYFYVPL